MTSSSSRDHCSLYITFLGERWDVTELALNEGGSSAGWDQIGALPFPHASARTGHPQSCRQFTLRPSMGQFQQVMTTAYSKHPNCLAITKWPFSHLSCFPQLDRCRCDKIIGAVQVTCHVQLSSSISIVSGGICQQRINMLHVGGE